MAMLEVHDGQGRVLRLQLTRDSPLMLGSSPKADVVIPGDGVFPFHARIRWRASKHSYRVEGFPDVEYILVNGRRMRSTQLGMGDEIEIGSHHIFVTAVNDDEVPVRKSPEDERTKILAHPTPSVERKVLPRTKFEPEAESAAGTLVFSEEELEENLKSRMKAAVKVDAKKPQEQSETPVRGWKRLFYLFSAKANAPGREEVFSSPLVVGLIATFVVLVGVGFGLRVVIARTTASRLFLQARENLDVGDYRNAIARFDEFLNANPDDKHAGEARVHRAMANVRQYASAAGASWSLALEAEKSMIESVGEEEAFKDSSTELDELVLKTGESLADRAKQSGDRRALDEAESIVSLHNRLTGANAESLLKRSRFPEKIEAARAAVAKAETRVKAFAAMDAALKEESSKKVYEARDRLVERYADQARDAQLLSRMMKANELIRKGVTLDTSTRPAETEPYPTLLGPPTSLVLRWPDPTAANSPASATGPIVYAMSEGNVLGIDGTTGNPIWQSRMGESPFPPQPIPGGAGILVFNAINEELVRLDGSTGSLVWRQIVGERLTSPPLVLGNQVIQSLPSGKLLFLDVQTGALKATMSLGMAVKTSAVANESGQSFFITADRDCLFVIKRDPLSCVAVEYLGHDTGSIAVPPARVGRYLVIPENINIEDGRWRVFVIDEEGFKVKHVQDVPVIGWTWGTPSSLGSVIWSAGDRGALAAFAIGPYDEKNPFREIARISPDNGASAPAFTYTKSERDIWISSSRSGRFELDVQTQKLNAVWTLAAAGPASAAPQAAGNLLVLTHQNVEGPGTALWAVEPKSGKLVWRTILGSGWRAPLTFDVAAGPVSTFGIDGRPISLSKEELGRGGFTYSSIPGPGVFRLPIDPLARLDGKGWTVIVPAIKSKRVFVRSGEGPFIDRQLPAPIGARPMAFQGGLLLPGDDGRVYLIDPETGESRAEPFIPPFDRTRPTLWRAPVAIGADAFGLVDEAGHIRKIAIVSDPRPRLVAAIEEKLSKDIVADPAATKDALVVLTDDGLVRSLSTRDFSSVGSWPLKSPLGIPLQSLSERICVVDTLGNFLMIGADGQRLWEQQIKDATLAGPPCLSGETLWCLTRGGEMVSLAVGDGATLDRVRLESGLRGGAASFGENLAVPTGAGTLQLWSPKTSPSSNP